MSISGLSLSFRRKPESSNHPPVIARSGATWQSQTLKPQASKRTSTLVVAAVRNLFFGEAIVFYLLPYRCDVVEHISEVVFTNVNLLLLKFLGFLIVIVYIDLICIIMP